MKYTEPGEYELTYTAIDFCGNEATATRVITVEPPLEEITLNPPRTAFLVGENMYAFTLAEPLTLNAGDEVVVVVNGTKSEPIGLQETSGGLTGEFSLGEIIFPEGQGSPITYGNIGLYEPPGTETMEFILYKRG